MKVNKNNNHFLELKVNNEMKSIDIIGNKEGLEFLSEVCSKLSKLKDEEHWHMSSAFDTISKGSYELIIHKVNIK